MIHTSKESKEKICKNQTKLRKPKLKLSMVYIGSNKGHKVSVSQKLVKKCLKVSNLRIPKLKSDLHIAFCQTQYFNMRHPVLHEIKRCLPLQSYKIGMKDSWQTLTVQQPMSIDGSRVLPRRHWALTS